jgi:hypothetical protein
MEWPPSAQEARPAGQNGQQFKMKEKQKARYQAGLLLSLSVFTRVIRGRLQF